MEESIELLIPDLPEDFRKTIHNHTRLYSVTMLMADSDQSENVVPCSGTLCNLKSAYGILTARHVWESAKKFPLLLVMTSRGPFKLKTDKIVPIVPKAESVFPNTDATLPDIAFLQIDLSQKHKIEALGKVFYSIDRRAEKLDSYLNRSDGYWSIFGNPKELMQTNLHKVTSFIYGTGIDNMVEINGWDYKTVLLNIPDNPPIPEEFGGVSGGGVWRSFWTTDKNKELFIVSNIFEDIVLSGISFYQIYGENSKLIAHGPKSIYKNMLELL